MFRAVVAVLVMALAMGRDVNDVLELSVRLKGGTAEVVKGIDKSAAAWGSMQHTGSTSNDTIQAMNESRIVST